MQATNQRKNMRYKQFEDYSTDAANWITLATGEFYPDVLIDACALYQPIIDLFGKIVSSSDSSIQLVKQIDGQDQYIRTQLMRVFRKYCAPNIPVEMLKVKRRLPEIIKNYGSDFRAITIVQQRFNERPNPDEAICALLWEYKDRGKKGYDLTERFFDRFETEHPDYSITGPRRAGKDVQLKDIFTDYPYDNRPTDFIVKQKQTNAIVAVGFARYDGDRGGSQEDDRTGENQNCAREILEYFKDKKMNTKIIFLNDGPGLLLGSMWKDYVFIENIDPKHIMVLTLRMVTERLTEEWLKSK